jgi:AraC-like DNA-binding protein
MSGSFDWASVLMLMGGGQGFLLFAALWRKRKKSPRANRLLAILMLLTAVRLIWIGLARIGAIAGTPDWTLPLIWTYSPLLYLYCRRLIVPGTGRRAADAFHFAPAVIWAAGRALSLLVSRPAKPLGPPAEPSLVSFLPDVFWLIQTVVYLLLIRSVLRRHSLTSTRELSDVNSIRLTWIRTLAGAFGFLCGLVAFFLAGSSLGVRFVEPSNTVLYVSVAVVVYVWGWFGLRQPIVLSAAEMERTPKETAPPPAPSARSEESLKRLSGVMEALSPHLDPGLTLHELARIAGLPAYQLTELLNGVLGQTFYAFVNRRRIEEAKKKLSDPGLAHLKILSIALDCGFASKSAFNRVFREFTGRTPSDYRKRLEQGAGTEKSRLIRSKRS